MPSRPASGNLLGCFLKRWEEFVLNAAYVQEKKQVTAAFGTINPKNR